MISRPVDPSEIGHFVLPIAAIQREGTSDGYFPPQVPALPEGAKTESDGVVPRRWSDVHLDLGIEAMTDIAVHGEPIKHFTF